MTTAKRFHRSMAEAFPADRYNWGDRRVMRAVVPDFDAKRGVPPPEFDQPRWPFEAASAVSEFGHEDPQPQTVSLWQRITRFFRAQQIKRLRP